MSKQVSKSPLKFLGYDFVEVSHKVIPENTVNAKNVKYSISGKYKVRDAEMKKFDIIITVHLSEETFFNLRVVFIGRFEITGSYDNKVEHDLIHQNAPAICFPYIRSFISTLTANMGTQSVRNMLMPLVRIAGELQQVDSYES